MTMMMMMLVMMVSAAIREVASSALHTRIQEIEFFWFSSWKIVGKLPEWDITPTW